MRYIGNVHTYFPQSFSCLPYRKCIVEILGIYRINGECGDRAEILTLGNLLLCDVCRQLGGSLLYGFGIFIRQAILGKNSIHLCIVLTALSKDIDNFTHRILAVHRPLDQFHHSLITVLSTLEHILWNEYIAGHHTILCYEEGIMSLYMQFSDKCIMDTLYNLHNLPFTATTTATGK